MSYKKRTLPKNYVPYVPRELTEIERAIQASAEQVVEQEVARMDYMRAAAEVMRKHAKTFKKLKESGD